MAQSVDALANVARLKASPGRSNFANYENVFAGPAEGHVPSAHEQFTGDANSDAAATALGAGPAYSGIQRAFEQQQLQDTEAQLNTEADLAGGRPQRIAGMQHAAHNTLADVDSEAAARREFLPNASDLHQRNVGDLLHQNETRYLLPAQLDASSRENAATIEAKGHVDAAHASDASLPLRGLQNALRELISTGKIPTPDDLAKLKLLYHVQ